MEVSNLVKTNNGSLPWGSLLGLLGTLLTIWAGFFTYYLTEHQKRELAEDTEIRARNERKEKEAEAYLKDQLRFYSVIHTLLEANQAVFNKLGGDHLEYPSLSPEQQVVVDKIIIPNNSRIVQQITKNPHLIEGAVLPASYKAFLAHATMWRTLNEMRSISPHISYSPQELTFPEQFDLDITTAAEAAKTRYYDFIKRRTERNWDLDQ